ncbi:hypothetical protein [Kribbella swartbergensis]
MSFSTCASAVPDPPDGALVVLVAVGVLVRVVGLGDGFGVRLPSRLGAVVDRRGVGLGLVAFDRVGVAAGFGVVRREGVDAGVVARVVPGPLGVRDVSSDVVVNGRSWLVRTFAVRSSTNHPIPAITTSAVSDARIGPITPWRCGRRWLVMVSSLAQFRRG